MTLIWTQKYMTYIISTKKLTHQKTYRKIRPVDFSNDAPKLFSVSAKDTAGNKYGRRINTGTDKDNYAERAKQI